MNMSLFSFAGKALRKSHPVEKLLVAFGLTVMGAYLLASVIVMIITSVIGFSTAGFIVLIPAVLIAIVAFKVRIDDPNVNPKKLNRIISVHF
jgi:hypothetical protein